MTLASQKYTGANGADMTTDITSVADTTDLGASIDLAFYVNKTTVNKTQTTKALKAILQKITTESWP